MVRGDRVRQGGEGQGLAQSAASDRDHDYVQVETRSTRGHRFVQRRGRISRSTMDAPGPEVQQFHRSLFGYTPTPLRELPALAAELGCERLWAKDESSRFELPAFKILGAAWAGYWALCRELGLPADPGQTPIAAVAQALAATPMTFMTATDGNHGRAVARVATMFGCAAQILVPRGTAQARIDAILGEEATCEIWPGSYDDAVAEAKRRAAPGIIVLPDIALGAEDADLPLRVIDGYSTILREFDQQVAESGGDGPDVVFVQAGVGALATAVVRHFSAPGVVAQALPEIVVVEPLDAACALESALAGASRVVPGPHRSVMAGLNAGTVTLPALTALRHGVNAYCAIPDGDAQRAVRVLSDYDLKAGETGAAGLAGLMACVELGLRPRGRWRRPLVIVTEGVTDPISFEQSMRGQA
jgi:diaminopropionate ammonia-lyase